MNTPVYDEVSRQPYIQTHTHTRRHHTATRTVSCWCCECCWLAGGRGQPDVVSLYILDNHIRTCTARAGQEHSNCTHNRRATAGHILAPQWNVIHIINRCRLYNCQLVKSWRTRIRSSGTRWPSSSRSVCCSRPAGGDRRRIGQWWRGAQRRQPA